VLIVAWAPSAWAVATCIAWGMALLALLTYRLARERGVGAAGEIGKHLAVACAVLLLSRGIAEALGRA